MEKKIRKITDKKAQHEIVGFVLIVLIVVIIGVIFFGIYLRNSKIVDISTEDADISNFLSSSMKYTTDCILIEPLYADANEVISGCYENKMCSDERSACSVLNSTYEGMMDNLWPANEDRPIKYSKLSFYYQFDLEDQDTRTSFLEIEKGDKKSCSNKRIGKSDFKSGYIIELEICS